VIDGTLGNAREDMRDRFGSKWAFQYPSEEAAGVEKWGLKRIDLPLMFPERSPQLKSLSEAQSEREEERYRDLS